MIREKLSGPLSLIQNWIGIGTRPQMLIVGVQKAGTTTLFDLLDSFPEFCGARTKEVGYFINDAYFQKGPGWYLSRFSRCKSGSIRFEATPEYFYYPEVPKRIADYNGAMKIIVLFREPAQRCLSAWNMFRHFNKNSAQHIYDQFVADTNPDVKRAARELLFTQHFPSFEQAIVDDIKRFESKSKEKEPSFVRRGIYFEQVQNFLQYFPMENFLFLEQRDLNQSAAVLERIETFLGIKIRDSRRTVPLKSNIGTYVGQDNDTTRVLSKLKEFYRPHNEKLFEQIGIRYDWND